MPNTLLMALSEVAGKRSSLLEQEALLWKNLSELLARAPSLAEPKLPPQAKEPSIVDGLQPGRLLRVRQAADLLGLSTQTLNNWRVTGGGPEFIKLGRRVLYRRETVDEFISSKTVAHTSAYLVGQPKARAAKARWPGRR